MNQYNEQRQLYLTTLLNDASVKYYHGKETGISDTDFDLYLHELMELEKESGVVYPLSPTRRVGSDIQDGFKKGRHPSPMLTIDNTYTDEGLQAWLDKKAEDWGDDMRYHIGTKFDGVSLELKYVNGHFVSALTRGDKNVGDDVTENAKTIYDIPLEINYDSVFYVRGEVMLPKSRLEKINAERAENGEELFSNSRNACSGSLKQLNPKITAQRGLIFRAWDCIGEPIHMRTMEEKIDFLGSLGFETGEVSPVVCGSKDVVKTVSIIKEKLDNSALDYDYDGVVIKINDIATQTKIGTKDTRAIEWGIARKWNTQAAVTKLLGVDWQVGRTGVLTPVARLVPVECGGVTVSNATLHNYGFIEKADIRIGDNLRIIRSGDVIPYVEGVVFPRDENTTPVLKPEICPICGSSLEYEGELIKCVSPWCNAQKTGKILQFCSKDCMDIKTIGKRVAEDLVLTALVIDYWDLYELDNKYSYEELAEILGPGYGAVSVMNMLDAIEDSKERPFENVLASLSIPGVGKTTARILVQEFGNIDALASATGEELKAVNGIGEIMANDIYNWFHSDFGRYSVERMKAYGLNTEAEMAVEESGSRFLEGLTVCFTGKSSRFSGDDVEAFLESAGAKCTHSVSKSLDYLITGEKPGGSKVQKAEAYGVKIISEKDFYEKFGL